MVPLFSKEKRFFENKGASNRLAVRAEFLAASNFSTRKRASLLVASFFFKVKVENRAIPRCDFSRRDGETRHLIIGSRCQIVLINLLR